MAGEIIPFGKYKGQPVEAMAQDKQYVDWLTAQPWFRDKFQAIYTVIINNFQQPADTPEHNALQVLFLKPDFCQRFVEFLKHKPISTVWRAKFEEQGFDVCLFEDDWRQYFIEIKPQIGDDYPSVLRQIKAARDAPVVERAGRETYYRDARRQAVLFLEKYVGEAVTEQDLIDIFEADDIQIVFLDEVIG